MTDLQTIKSWFRTRCKPTQAQFWETFDSFWHKAEGISVTAINGLMEILNSKAAAIHTHAMSAIEGLTDALAGKAAADHTHSQYLTQHQDISGKQDKTDDTLQTTDKTIVGAIHELLAKFSNYALANHTHNGYLTEHQDISGKQDVISDLGTIRANAQMAATRAYTLDFGTAAELIQDVNMLGAITINELHALNVAHLYVTYGNVTHQEIDLTQPISLNVANHAIITWEIVRTTDDGLACVGVRCSINQSNA